MLDRAKQWREENTDISVELSRENDKSFSVEELRDAPIIEIIHLNNGDKMNGKVVSSTSPFHFFPFFFFHFF